MFSDSLSTYLREDFEGYAGSIEEVAYELMLAEQKSNKEEKLQLRIVEGRINSLLLMNPAQVESLFRSEMVKTGESEN